jgi:phage/plasmid-like protein (TIGR03299 family)
MAHNLAFDATAGRHAMFSGDRKAAWHNLGVVVDGALNWQDAMQTALLDWQVDKVQFNSPLTGSPVDSWGIFRNDTQEFLGAVGNNYTPIQNRYAFAFVDSILEADNHAHYTSAGALGKGERIWCLAKVNGDIQVAGTDDKHETYLLFTTSHDGSASAICKLTTVRVVCQNTLTQALNQNGAFLRVKHTQNAEAKMNHARSLMQGVHAQVADIENKFNLLAQRKVTPDSITAVMKKLFGDWEEKKTAKTENKVAEILQLFASNDHDAIPEVKGTAYNLLNAITEYQDHFAAFRRTDGKADMAGNVIRSENALFGVGATLKENALEVVLEATKNDPYHQVMRRYVTVPTQIVTPKPVSLLDSIIDGM